MSLEPDLDSIAEHAHETRVVVVGGGVAGLVAALQCAKVGMQVTVLEASDRLGGVVRETEVAGLRLDAGAESFATRGGHVRALIDDRVGQPQLVDQRPDRRIRMPRPCPAGASSASRPIRGRRRSGASSGGAARGARTSTACARP